ncbi:MAG: isovaleryl-CoA dehydrogenase [Deltaproteobacteria bacterium]|jgi:putative acyl-CoA dehydrogenase|nr:isovaleryl-CoA dehydrogenase [Deltaproteobacteria bacterium]
MSIGGFETHEVENQPPPLEGRNLYAGDAALREGLLREGGAWAEERVTRFGEILGRAETIELGRDANRHPPELRSHDRFGHRIDEVAFHPAWHAVMALAMEHELHNLPWRNERAGAYVARTALHSLLSQVEAGACCPLTMTFACVPALRHAPEIAAEWEPRLHGTAYDPVLRPPAEKGAVLVGMAMTEKQGGSDVRSNSTRAHPIGNGPEALLVGHKWFCSAPMSDAFLALAQTDRGLACFLVPRFRPDGSQNPIRLQRLKDKLGNRSNASAEIEFAGTWATRIGEEGRGVRTILEMVHHTRLDCVSGSAGLMRQALSQALHHARHRGAFGKRLWDQPLMAQVLADLALESEAATALMLRLARAYDAGGDDPAEHAFARIATAVGKYWVCKRTPAMVYEAMECLGGNGYVEDSSLPRLYREAPVNAIWEGSGNVICLDVLRAMVREPESTTALLDEIRAARGANRHLDAASDELGRLLASPEDAEAQARRWVERMALLLQASLLVRHAPAAVADAFCASRLGGEGGLAFGTLGRGADVEEITARASGGEP